jgi:hypothetical protein
MCIVVECGRLSELIDSVELTFLRCAVNTVTRIHAETNSNDLWQTYRHTLSIPFDFALSSVCLSLSAVCISGVCLRVCLSVMLQSDTLSWLAPMNTLWNLVDTLCNLSPSILEHMDRSSIWGTQSLQPENLRPSVLERLSGYEDDVIRCI